MKKLSLYLHIPFCKQKCAYCDFVSGTYSIEMMEKYLEVLIEEIKQMGKELSEYQVHTIFVGGGTPTVLPAPFMARLLKVLPQYFMVSAEAEITVEANPDTLTEQMLLTLKECGVNRLSMGLQAWQNSHLQTLGRIHTREQFLKAYCTAKNAGFHNINIDLMFALPNQTMEEWRETIEEVCALRPTHLSCYALKIEEDTPFYEKGIMPINEELDREMYHYARDILIAHGYGQYEISNFAQKGYICQHNLTYWTGGDYVGCGVAAHSYLRGERYARLDTFAEYMEKPNVKAESQFLSEEDEAFEMLMLGLRMTEGVSLAEYKRKFGKDIDLSKIKKYFAGGFIKIENERLKLTVSGLDICNLILTDLM